MSDAPEGLDDFIGQPTTVASAAPASSAPPGLDEFVAPEVKNAKYGTFEQQAKGFLETAASVPTWGVSKGIERALGIDPEEIKERKAHQGFVTGMAAGTTGIVAGAAAAYGLAQISPALAPLAAVLNVGGVMTRGGAAGASALGLGAAEGFIGKAAQLAVKGAIEAGIFQGTDEVGKLMLSDPQHVADHPAQYVGTAAANIGLAGLIGAPLNVGFGAIGGGTKSLWNATIGKKVAPALDGLHNSITGGAAASAEEAGAFSPLLGEKFQTDALGAELSKPKANAEEIKAAADRLGMKPTTGTLSESPVIQKMESSLSENPGLGGILQAKEYKENLDVFRKNVQSTLSDSTTKTEAQVGSELKKGTLDILKKDAEAVKEAYGPLTEHLKNISVPDEAKADAIKAILDHPQSNVTKENRAFAENIAAEIQNKTDVEQLRAYRTNLNNQLKGAYAGGKVETTPILQEAVNQLAETRKASIDIAARSGTLPEGAPATLYSDLQKADILNTEFNRKLERFGVETGLGNITNIRSLLAKFSKISDESFIRKFFSVDDLEQLKYMQEKYPEQFELARRFKKKEIFDYSTSNREGDNRALSPQNFIKALRDLSPEAREIVFRGHQEKLADLETMYYANPTKYNVSNTAPAIQWSKILTPGGLIDSGASALQYAFLKSQPYLNRLVQSVGGGEAAELAALKVAHSGAEPNASAFGEMVKSIAQTIKGERLIQRSIDGMFEAGRQVLPSHFIPDSKEKDRLEKQLKGLQVNNSLLFNVGGDLGHYMPEHQTALAQTAVNAVNYLNNIRPVTKKANMLDSESVLTTAQKTDYDRALEIAAQPLVVLPAIKDCTLTPADLIHMRGMYPGLYTRLSMKLNEGIIKATHDGTHIPYKTRMGLTMFLGQPMDSTMTPQGIGIAQMAAAQSQRQAQAKEQAQQVKAKGSMSSLKKMASSEMTPGQAREAHRGGRI